MNKKLVSWLIVASLAISILPTAICAQEGSANVASGTEQPAGTEQPVSTEQQTETKAEDTGDIEWSLSDKGQLILNVTGDYKSKDLPWKDVLSKVKSVKASGQGLTTMASFFEGCTNLTAVDLRDLDTSKVTDFSKVFKGCTSLKTIDLSVDKDSKWDVSAGTDFTEMFAECSKLSSLSLDDWKLNKEKSVSLKGIFKECDNIEKIDLSTWTDTAKVKSLEESFCQCKSLTYVNFLGFDFSGVDVWKKAFYNDEKLSCKVDLLRATISNDIKDAFKNAATEAKCEIVIRYAESYYETYAQLLMKTADLKESNISTFLIRDIDSDKVKLSESTFYYTGEEIKPTVSITYTLSKTEEKDGKKTTKTSELTLKQDEDFRVTYSNNTDVSKKALVTIKGIGDYRGSFEKNFTIKLKSNTLSVSASKEYKKDRSTKAQTITFMAEAVEGIPTVTSSTSKVAASIDDNGKVTVKIAPKYVGEAIIAVKSKETKYYASCRKNIVITVRPNTVSITSLVNTKKGYISLKWKKPASASGYIIKCSKYEDMSKSKTMTISKASTLTKNITGLEPETTYYISMRCYWEAGGTTLYSNWSTKQVITTAPIAISKTSATIKKGKTLSLSITGTSKTVAWTSSNKKIATVDSKGLVKGKKKGTVTITATVDGRQLFCKVKVKKPKKKKKDKDKK